MHKSSSPGPPIHLSSLSSNSLSSTGNALHPTSRPSLTSLPASPRYTPSLGVATSSPFSSSLLTNIPPSSHRPSSLLATMQRPHHLSPPLQLKHEQSRFNPFSHSSLPPLISSLSTSHPKLTMPDTSTSTTSLSTPLSHPFSGSFLTENLLRNSTVTPERPIGNPFLSSSSLSLAAHQVGHFIFTLQSAINPLCLSML